MRYFIFFALFQLPSLLLATERDSIFVSQYVRDSFTQFGVRNALVTVMDMDGQVIDTLRTVRGSGSHDAQLWRMTIPRRSASFRIRVEHPDYETGEMTVEMKNPARLNSYHFPDMLLKRSFAKEDVELDEVVVQATRVQLCYKGDTIEVDARAFKLSEGSMLESLVRNVPGCELDEKGDIYMNGKKVDYLTLNGKDFFKGNNRVMLDNLPYYTVDKLQFYNQRSERSQLMGKDVERPDFVMNVKLKQEYSIGYLGNAEAGAGTEERWMARAFALRFTDNSRLSLFGNVNNVNETRRPGADGMWGQSNSPEGDTKTYNVGADLMIDDKHGRYKEEFNTAVKWNNSHNEQTTATQQFLQQGDAFKYSSNATRNKGFELKANNKLTLKRIGLVSNSRFEYSNNDNDAISRSAQFSEQPEGDLSQVLDSIFSASRSSEMLEILVNNLQDSSFNNTKKWTAEQKFDYHKSLPWGDDLMLSASGVWNGSRDRGNRLYELQYANGETPDDVQYRLTRDKSNAYNLRFGADYAIHFLSSWHLMVGLAHVQRHTRDRDNLYRLDWDENFLLGEALPSVTDYLSLRDANNSPDADNTQREEHITATLHRHNYDSKRGRYLAFTAVLNTRYAWQEGVYTRGENTARPSDHRWLFKPSVDFEYQTRQWHETYKFHYDTDMRSLNLSQVADLTDTSDPLAIRTGNADLRPSSVHNLSFLFMSRFGTHGQFASLRTAATITSNQVAMNSVYNQETGGYTYTPVNVNGNWNSNSSLELRRALNESRSLNIESRTAYSFQHSVDMKNDARSTVRQHSVNESLKLEYKHKWFTLALLGGVSWTGMRVASVDDINAVNFNYGANLQADLPWKLYFSTDIRMYSRRGYADESLCTNDLLWNAQLNRSFLKGRLLASVKAFDLLRQISSTHTTYNSQARTETWSLSLPSYFMFSVQYKFNKNPKK